MGLELIVGPPNSGRAQEIMRRLRDAADRDPLLVVPTGEDIARFERDLCADGTPAIGATIRTFASLTDAIATATAARIPPMLTPPQRLSVLRAAIAATPLRLLRRSAAAPGFAIALDALIAELQGALITPADLRGAAEVAESAGHELELAELYRAYENLRDRAGRSDAGSVMAAATAALRSDPDAWGRRPVLVYGFDDLSEAQLELVGLLGRTSAVTVAVNYADREALAARATLLYRLTDELGARIAAQLDFDPDYTPRASLRHLDRELFQPAAARVEPDGGLALLESAGERGEAEAVGLEIARLMADGVQPDEILVVLRRPAIDGPLMASVLGELGVPVALQAEIPLARTAVGRALLMLCRAASENGGPEHLIAHLRADPAVAPEAIDWLERAVIRGEVATVAETAARWQTPPAHLTRVLEAGGATARVRALAVTARRLAEAPHRERASLAGERSAGVPLEPVELRAGVAAAELLDELAAVGGLPGLAPPGLADAAEALETASVLAWQGSTEGRVRILSPYRARAARARFLFCATLMEGVFPSAGPTDPLLGERSRAELGIPALRRSEQSDEERYLFHVCVSRPLERLYLSWRSSDDDGRPAARSPFVDEVLDLIGPSPAEAEAALKRSRGLTAPVPAPHEAPTPRVLARAAVLRTGADPAAQRDLLARLGVDLATSGEVLALTATVPDPTAPGPGPLAHPLVLGELSSRRLLSAGSLENWIQCSYAWFVEHELAPQRLEPEADPLWLGGVIHDALHRLYEEPPGTEAIPRPGDVATWKARFGELVDEVVAAAEAPLTPDRRLALARLRIQVGAFLDTEAQGTTRLRPDAAHLERGFGFGEEDEDDPGALDLGDFSLRGRIDRIDVEPGGMRALIRDYKTSKEVPGVTGITKEGKLQLQLYMRAAQELLGLEPIGGLYQPLGAYGDRRPRGIIRKDECAAGGLFEGLEVSVGGDAQDPDTFTESLEEAVQLARSSGRRMLAGDIRRDPLGGRCSKYCTFQPICRLERALGVEDERENGE